MSDNIVVVDALSVNKTLRTTDSGGIHTPHNIIDSMPADPLGTNADAAITTDTTGSHSGKLRGLVKWAWERMPAALGQTTKSASLPVTLASNQDALPITDNSGSITVDGTVTVAASENHLGEVGRKLVKLTLTPTISTGIYASGDSLGGKGTIASAVRVSAGSGKIVGIELTDKIKQNATIDVVFFDADPSGGTYTDNAASNTVVADLGKVIGVVSLLTASYVDLGTISQVNQQTVIPFALPSGTSMYAVLIVRGSTPTYTGTSDISLKVFVEQN